MSSAVDIVEVSRVGSTVCIVVMDVGISFERNKRKIEGNQTFMLDLKLIAKDNF